MKKKAWQRVDEPSHRANGHLVNVYHEAQKGNPLHWILVWPFTATKLPPAVIDPTMLLDLGGDVERVGLDLCKPLTTLIHSHTCSSFLRSRVSLTHPSPVVTDKWWSDRLDQLGAVVTSFHAGGRGRVVAHGLQSRDLVGEHPLCLSSPV